MTAPTIKARPEFMRRGTPAKWHNGTISCVVLAVRPEAGDAYICKVKTGASHWTAISGLLVDLSDATGRAHVDWALSKKRCAGLGPDHWSHNDPRLGGGYGAHGHANGHPEVLATLNPNDDTRLPDGSRLVDALALKLVAEHVFGMEAS